MRKTLVVLILLAAGAALAWLMVARPEEKQKEHDFSTAQVEAGALGNFLRALPPGTTSQRELRDSAEEAWIRRDFRRMHALIDGPMDSASRSGAGTSEDNDPA